MMESQGHIWSKGLLYTLYATGVLLPFNLKVANYALGVFAAVYILVILKNFKACRFNFQLLYLPIIFFALYFIGLFYSSEIKNAFSDLGTKSTFLILPLLFSSGILPTDKFRFFRLSFIAGCLLVCLYNLTLSGIDYSKSGNANVFYYTSFSRIMHVQYMTIYLNLAVLFLINEMFDNGKNNRPVQILTVILIAFFFLNISLLDSRLATVVSYITSTLFTFLKIKTSGSILRFSIYAFLCILIIISVDYFSMRTNRFEQVSDLLANETNFYDFSKPEYSSTALRIPLWINAYQVIEDNPFMGVGTGDVRIALDSIYKKNGFKFAMEKKLNPHNQYLQTGVALGIVGITSLFAMLLIPIYYSIRYRHFLFLSLLIIFIFNMLTESILERQAGILIFSLLYSMFSVELNNSMAIEKISAVKQPIVTT
ncbi:MAG: O-antigen ligase family protein [Bacteroidetes bacterium]|nr:O-antigen ligase family protein [Bacteroidota bacterium]